MLLPSAKTNFYSALRILGPKSKNMENSYWKQISNQVG